MVYVKAATEAYNGEIIDDIIWVRRNFDLAEDMT